jgi:hypothetical protein
MIDRMLNRVWAWLSPLYGASRFPAHSLPARDHRLKVCLGQEAGDLRAFRGPQTLNVTDREAEQFRRRLDIDALWLPSGKGWVRTVPP